MKKLRSIILLIFISACTRVDPPQGTSSLVLVNAVVGTDKLVTNFEAGTPLKSYLKAAHLTYGLDVISYPGSELNRFHAYSGTKQLALFKYPDTTAHSTPLFNLTLNLPVGSMNSLFLTGTPEAPESVFTTDQPPYHPLKDSTAGLRFVNLSPGSGSISINIQGKPNGSEVNNLPYKSITGFKNYPATSDVSSYVLEFRNAETGTLLFTYTVEEVNKDGDAYLYNKWRFRNNTLAFVGVLGGTDWNNKQKVMRVEHD